MLCASCRQVFQSTWRDGRVLAKARPLALAAFKRSFQSTPRYQSHVGGAPLTIPPNVTFQVVEAPPVNTTGRMTRNAPTPTVQLEGPLGECARHSNLLHPAQTLILAPGRMDMAIPPFIKIEQDMAARRATVSVIDRRERHQREMWGVWSLLNSA
jgi:large subunit ribosomal protein L6